MAICSTLPSSLKLLGGEKRLLSALKTTCSTFQRHEPPSPSCSARQRVQPGSRPARSSLLESFPYQYRKCLRCCLKCSIGYRRAREYVLIRYTHMTSSLTTQVQNVKHCGVVLRSLTVGGGKVGMGNAPSQTYVGSSYRV